MSDASLKTYQKQWAYQKYWVMAHSQQHYNALRELFKGNQWSEEKVLTFHCLIEEAQAIPPTVKSLRTAYQHVWGYFKKVASQEEKTTSKIWMLSWKLNLRRCYAFYKR
ncbi:hypothetical protein SDSE167_0799 [Streptococcus dysgalactiae subsp. equisimilis 167]|nr:hypothetical protein SDSE167_0799 [Streptococcus dysgalactiae subsp. equisimilis 167]